MDPYNGENRIKIIHKIKQVPVVLGLLFFMRLPPNITDAIISMILAAILI
jgi:hypothetical protein